MPGLLGDALNNAATATANTRNTIAKHVGKQIVARAASRHAVVKAVAKQAVANSAARLSLANVLAKPPVLNTPMPMPNMPVKGRR